MHFSNDTSLAEQIRRKLKFDYYWLDFSVIVFEADSMYGWHMAFTENLDKRNWHLRPCVITTDHIGALKWTWKVILYVAPITPRNNTNEPTWKEMEEKVKDLQQSAKICNHHEKNCNATNFIGKRLELIPHYNVLLDRNFYLAIASPVLDDTTEFSSPRPFYIATTYYDVLFPNELPYRYIFSGPAVTTGRRAIGDEEFRVFTWEVPTTWLLSHDFEYRSRNFTVAAAVACDSDIFTY